MGAGIAAVFARAGASVRLVARRPATLAAARARLEAIAPAAAPAVLATTSLAEAVAGSELVIETIAEQLEPKADVLRRAQTVAPESIVTSNTSSLPLDEIAARLVTPERFAGLHWFNPPELVELVEIVPAARTDPAVVRALSACMDALGKAPIVLRRAAPGFVANRLQYALLRETYALVEGGVCSLEDVDRALTHGLGPRWAAVGPFATVDLAGLDVHEAVVRNLFPELSNERGVPGPVERVRAAGGLGCKNGLGLRGAYTSVEVEESVARRDRLLRGVARLRDEPRRALEP
jgi:3-hydroxybutyryl-CoA dehydrogenase